MRCGGGFDLSGARRVDDWVFFVCVFGLRTGFFGGCAFVPFFAIARSFKQKCGILWLLRCAVVRAGFSGDWGWLESESLGD